MSKKNIGTHALWIKELPKHLVAFEPSKPVCNKFPKCGEEHFVCNLNCILNSKFQENMQGIQTMTRCGCQNNLLEMPVLQNMILVDLSNDLVASVSVELDGIALSILKIYLLG